MSKIRRAKKLLKTFIFTSNHTPKRIFNLVGVFIQHQFIKGDRVKGYPVRLVIEPTNFCNLSCPLCPAGKDNKEHERGFMKIEDFKKVIDEVGDYLYEIDLYNFGESLLNNQIYDMISYAAKKKIATNLSTNLNLGDAKKIITSGLSKLIVSADGASNETYKQYRVYGNFETVLHKVKEIVNKKNELKSKTPKIVWQFITMKHNQHEIPVIKQLCKELGIGIDIKPMRLNTAIDIEVKQDKEKIGNKWLPTLDNLKRGGYKTNKPKRVGPKSCLFLWNQAVINWNGIVTPCCAIFDYNKYNFGDVKMSGGFLEAWNSETYQKARRMVKEMNPSLHDDKKFEMCVGCIKNEFVDV